MSSIDSNPEESIERKKVDKHKS